MSASTALDTAQLEATYEIIKTPLHSQCGHKIINWKNETNSIGRRIVCGLALAGLAFAGVIDMVVSVALGILTSPAELAGYQYSRNFFARVGYGEMTSLIFLTICQYENIKGETLE